MSRHLTSAPRAIAAADNGDGAQPCPAEKMLSREIELSDLPAVAALLTETFGYSPEYFIELLETLATRDMPAGFPRFGYALCADRRLVGAIITIFSSTPTGIRCHVTSWSVDARYRPFAAVFYSRALRHKNVTYLNMLAVQRSLPFIELQGFAKVSAGQFAAIPVLSRRKKGGVKLISPDMVSDPDLVGSAEQRLLLDHARFGCLCFWCVDGDRAYPFVLQRRNYKRFVPGAQLIYSRSLEHFVAFARPIGLYLAARGRFVVMINASGAIPDLTGKYFPGILALYAKGEPPAFGDLAYTQFAMHARWRKNRAAASARVAPV